MKKIIDAHIHLDLYNDEEIASIVSDLERVRCTELISVSFHLKSCEKNLQLANQFPQVKPAFGFHPEQPLPSDHEIADLFSFMEKNKDEMCAIGEIGLPYYMRTETPIVLDGYIELLDSFLKLSNKWNKPVVLHAVYDDAPIVCDLLEKHQITHAHFHWFKGDEATIERMIENGYYISITPDVLYEQEIQQLVKRYPLEKMMVETDGPWRFEGVFSEKMTHPKMIHQSISKIAEIKQKTVENVYKTLYINTKNFYSIK